MAVFVAVAQAQDEAMAGAAGFAFDAEVQRCVAAQESSVGAGVVAVAVDDALPAVAAHQGGFGHHREGAETLADAQQATAVHGVAAGDLGVEAQRPRQLGADEVERAANGVWAIANGRRPLEDLDPLDA